MSLLNALANLVTGHHDNSGQQSAHRMAMPQARPDFTYNPNPNTNIPYSTHDLNMWSIMPGGIGVPQQNFNIGQANGYQRPAVYPQGGQFNPGLTPLQSGYGGFAQNVQPTDMGLSYQTRDPQRNITLY